MKSIPLIEAPAEERLRSEIEALRREIEQLRNKKEKHRGEPQKPRARTLWLFGLGLLVVLALANRDQLVTASSARSPAPERGGTTSLARAGGDVTQRIDDIGDHVRKGQLMAVIAARRLDQQVLQTRAVFAVGSRAAPGRRQSRAGEGNEEPAHVTAVHYQNLVARATAGRITISSRHERISSG